MSFYKENLLYLVLKPGLEVKTMGIQVWIVLEKIFSYIEELAYGLRENAIMSLR
jgi:hypothetical protein